MTFKETISEMKWITVFGVICSTALYGAMRFGDAINYTTYQTQQVKEALREIVETGIAKSYGFGNIKNLNNEIEDMREKEGDAQGAKALLNYSHLVTLSILGEYQETPDQVSLQDAVKKRRGDCFNFATLTYGKFLYLSDLIDAQDLRDYVRFSLGVAENGKFRQGHAWIELRENDLWMQYETTTFQSQPSDGPEISAEMILNFPDTALDTMVNTPYVTAQYTSNGFRGERFIGNAFLKPPILPENITIGIATDPEKWLKQHSRQKEYGSILRVPQSLEKVLTPNTAEGEGEDFVCKEK